jgi:hypothetical protein
MQTFNTNKNILKSKVQNLLIHNHNGGKFSVSFELIGFMNYVVTSDRKSVTILDSNENPIKIENPKEFLEEISSLYFEAVNEYGIDYQKLKSSRNIKKALDL